tara:strand:- start:339 stop:440 length:102 start_codon:yes stop_codon:yes gene_type:complete
MWMDELHGVVGQQATIKVDYTFLSAEKNFSLAA